MLNPELYLYFCTFVFVLSHLSVAFNTVRQCYVVTVCRYRGHSGDTDPSVITEVFTLFNFTFTIVQAHDW